jgi:hypothetical protein
LAWGLLLHIPSKLSKNLRLFWGLLNILLLFNSIQ